MTILYITKNQATIAFDTYDRGYQNSPKGRQQLQSECDPETVAKVFTVWGSMPTCEDPIPPVFPEPTPPAPTADQLSILDLTEQTIDNDYRISILELGL